MKRIVTASVMGAFLLSAPAVFASDKAPLDASPKGSVKAEAAPVVKKPETAAPAAMTAPAVALKHEVAAPPKADAVKAADKPVVKTGDAKAETAKPETVKAETPKSVPSKAVAPDAKPSKEAKPEAKPVTLKPAEAAKTTAEAARKPEAAAAKAN